MRLNQKGFSIAQMVVASSVMSVIGLGLTGMIQNQAKTVFYLEDQMSHQNFKKELETLLLDNGICGVSLFGKTLPTALVSASPSSGTDFSIINPSGAVLFNPADTDKNSFDNLIVDQIKMQNIDVTNPLVGGNVNLQISIRRKRGSSNQALKNVNIVKLVTLDASWNVQTCLGSSSSGNLGHNVEGIQAIVPNSTQLITGAWTLANISGTYVDTDASALNGTIWTDSAGITRAYLVGGTGGAASGVVTPTTPICIWDATWLDYKLCVRKNIAGQVSLEAASRANGYIVKSK